MKSTDRVRNRKQAKFTDFLKGIEGTKNLNEEKDSESKGDSFNQKKHSLIALSSDEE